MSAIAMTSIIAGGISFLSLFLLHFTSPEFKPSWRMVSEYALGKYKWLITTFFVLWGTSSILLSIVLFQEISGFWAYFGDVLLAFSGVGAICGGLFDLNHKLHGFSFALGVPTLPIGAVILSYHLVNANIISDSNVICLAHSTWISIILMGVSMMLMFAGFKKAGVAWDKDAPPPTEVPKGVIALGGYANRILVICHMGWVMYVAYLLLY